MVTITGYLAKYSETGFRGTQFKPGCFDECDGEKIPIVSRFNEMQNVGYGILKVVEDGLKIEGEIDETEIEKIPYPVSFAFKGHHLIKVGDIVESVRVYCCSLTNIPTATSFIETVNGVEYRPRCGSDPYVDLDGAKRTLEYFDKNLRIVDGHQEIDDPWPETLRISVNTSVLCDIRCCMLKLIELLAKEEKENESH